jgi:UDP-N-acetyl-2-amino-2-deoxyglucuronate dehydrogenase
VPLKVAFIGTGQIAEAHLKGLQALKGAPGLPALELAALVDPYPERAERFVSAHLPDAPSPLAFESVEALLASSVQPDIASVLVPHHLHLPIVEALLARGIAVQLQKPIGLGLKDAQRIVELAQSSGVPLVVSEPSVLGREQAVIQKLRSGQPLGKPNLLIDQAVLDLGEGFFMTPWRHLKGFAGAGWFLDHGVHRTHWMLEVLGPCKRVHCVTRQLEPIRKDARWGELAVDTEDLATALLEFESGAVCQFSVMSGGRGQWHFQVQLWCERGSYQGGKAQLTLEKEPSQLALEAYDWPDDPFAHSFWELLHLMQGSSKGVICTAERARSALAIIYACLESSQTQAPVAVEDVESGKLHAYEDTVWQAYAQLQRVDFSKYT